MIYFLLRDVSKQASNMRVVIQRVSQASVSIDGQVKAEIKQGLLLLAGFEEIDTEKDLQWTSAKVAALRIFNDDAGLMNKSVRDVDGSILLVSQFTLFASCKKGNRPSFIRAAKPDVAIPLYEKFIALLEKETGRKIETGTFGADMKMSLINEGPVTITIDSKMPE
jgi:D-tyrosyl-tRNA(Tyr) deacylase